MRGTGNGSGKNAESLLTIGNERGIIYSSSNSEWLRYEYEKALSKDEIADNVPFLVFIENAKAIDDMLVGTTTSDNIQIKGYTGHFVARVIGCAENNRQPCDIDDLKNALETSQDIKIKRPENSKPSNVYITDKVIVTINPETGILVQCVGKERK